MLALSQLDPTITAVIYVIAVALFVVAAFGWGDRPSLGWLGLAFFAFPVMWTALVVA